MCPSDLDQFDGVRLRQRAFVGHRRIEGGEINHADRLRAEHERIVTDAFSVDLGGNRGGADLIKTFLRIGADAALEQVRGHDVD